MLQFILLTYMPSIWDMLYLILIFSCIIAFAVASITTGIVALIKKKTKRLKYYFLLWLSLFFGIIITVSVIVSVVWFII